MLETTSWIRWSSDRKLCDYHPPYQNKPLSPPCAAMRLIVTVAWPRPMSNTWHFMLALRWMNWLFCRTVLRGSICHTTCVVWWPYRFKSFHEPKSMTPGRLLWRTRPPPPTPPAPQTPSEAVLSSVCHRGSWLLLFRPASMSTVLHV